jgi:hypothetical protein
MLLESSITLLENIYSAGVTHDDHIFKVQATGLLCYNTFYNGNLPPFYCNTVTPCYKAIFPWQLLCTDGKLPK